VCPVMAEHILASPYKLAVHKNSPWLSTPTRAADSSAAPDLSKRDISMIPSEWPFNSRMLSDVSLLALCCFNNPHKVSDVTLPKFYSIQKTKHVKQNASRLCLQSPGPEVFHDSKKVPCFYPFGMGLDEVTMIGGLNK
jgi:hypothetical protein